MIILYKGRRGCGKTLTMVKDAYIYHNNGWPVYHNFSLGIGTQLENKDILSIDKNSVLRECVLVIDEAQIFFDSRRSMKKENLKFSNFLQQIRKRKIILLVTTQYTNTVDLRLRQHVDVVCRPKHNKEFDVVEAEYIDVTAVEDSDFDGYELNKAILVFDAKPFYSLYDTETLI